jgi:hypothetical protein
MYNLCAQNEKPSLDRLLKYVDKVDVMNPFQQYFTGRLTDLQINRFTD